jgi:hypothetical protein
MYVCMYVFWIGTCVDSSVCMCMCVYACMHIGYIHTFICSMYFPHEKKNMKVHIHTYTHIWINIYIYIYEYPHTATGSRFHTRARDVLYARLWWYAYTHTCIRTYIHTYEDMYIYTHTHIYIYIYIWIRTHATGSRFHTRARDVLYARLWWCTQSDWGWQVPCKYVCMRVCMYVCMRDCDDILNRIGDDKYLVSMYVCVRVCMYVVICVCVYIYLYTYIYVCVCVCVHVCVL